MTLGEKIKQLRKERNISQTELAKIIGVHQSHIGRYERDESTPTAYVIKKLAEVLKVSADYLLSEEEEEIAASLTSDKELLQQFQDISRLAAPDKQFIKRMIKMAINDAKIKEMAS
jgi:transcriptional regulator with XRE-family HTH domain